MWSVKIPEKVEPEDLKRELARRGYQVVKSNFPHNTITNERDGQGVIQIRAQNDRYHEQAQKEVEEIGLKFSKLTKPSLGRVETRWR